MQMSKNKCSVCGSEYDSSVAGGLCPRCLMRGAKTADPEAAAGPLAPDLNKHVPPKPAVVDQLFPELEILDVVGHGGMGVVYKARQKNLGREVAVKLLSTSLLNDPMFAERFSREARAMAMMNHPNIIAIYDFGQRGQYYYLVMEYVDGLNLRQLVSTTKLDPAEAMELVPQLCDALQYAHDRGVVHRDIKPENVLVSQDGQVKIADFGLAKLTAATGNYVTLTQTKHVMGTVNYMAPEQMERPTQVDHRADIYSLGVVIYELLTGELPIGKFSPPSEKVQVDVRLDEVVLRALEKEPGMRYQQASEFKTGLQSVAVGRVPPVLTPQHSDIDIATKIAKFIFMAIAITIGAAGVVSIVLSSVDNSFLTEDQFRTIGFILMGVCGLLFALYGIFNYVFNPKEDDDQAKIADRQAKKDEAEQTPPTSVLVIRGIAMASFFTCALFFVASSEAINIGLGEKQARFIGIALALGGAFLFSIAGMVAKAKGYQEPDDD